MGWQYMLICLFMSFSTIFAQFMSSKQSRNLKIAEGRYGDQRLKLIGDIVSGARTIKCYGWE